MDKNEYRPLKQPEQQIQRCLVCFGFVRSLVKSSSPRFASLGGAQPSALPCCASAEERGQQTEERGSMAWQKSQKCRAGGKISERIKPWCYNPRWIERKSSTSLLNNKADNRRMYPLEGAVRLLRRTCCLWDMWCPPPHHPRAALDLLSSFLWQVDLLTHCDRRVCLYLLLRVTM